MNAPNPPPTNQPLLVDEVDTLVEYVDSCVPGVGAETPAETNPIHQPVLTDVVDQLVEYVDRAEVPENQPLRKTGFPVFIDTVDRIEEFVDRQLPSSVEVV